MVPRITAIMIGVLSAVLIVAGARSTTHDGLWTRHDICAMCAAKRKSTRLLRIPIGTEILETERSRWLLSHACDHHVHSWVLSHTGRRGWYSCGVGCARPPAAWNTRTLWSAHQNLGDDPSLIAIVEEFVSTSGAEADRRRDLADRAWKLWIAQTDD